MHSTSIEIDLLLCHDRRDTSHLAYFDKSLHIGESIRHEGICNEMFRRMLLLDFCHNQEEKRGRRRSGCLILCPCDHLDSNWKID